MGNTKGAVAIVTQNGPTLPSGMPNFTDGTVAPGATSLLSGRAFAGNVGTARSVF